MPVAARYNPVTNPGGIKCTSFEQIATQLGRNPANGFAWRPLDNIGLQYGLTALQSGAITPEQFVSLNENAGGFDFIGQVVPQRVAADPIGIVNAYETGRMNTGGLGLATTPIIDARTYTDFPGDIHTRVHSFVTRARLQEANGTFGNHVMLIANAAGSGAMTVEALTQMEAWLAAIHADDAPGTAQERMLRNRPVALTDACWAGSTKIAEPFGLGLARHLRSALPDVRGDPHGRRLAPGERCVQVPAEAARLRRLCRVVHACAAGAAPGDVPDGRLRLEQAGRRRAAAARSLARLRRLNR